MSRFRLVPVAALLAACALLPLTAQATVPAPLTAQQVMSQFNLVVFGDVNSSNHVDGRSWVGGNVSGGTFAMHDPLPASNYAGLTVLGNASNAALLAGGYAVKGNSTGGSVNNNGGGVAAAAVLGTSTNTNYQVPSYAGVRNGGQTNGGTFSPLSNNATAQGYVDAMQSTDFASVMKAESTLISGLAANSTISINGITATFNAVADANGRAVFDIANDASFFASIGEIEINFGTATTVLINSDWAGGSTAINFNGVVNANAGKVLWNFSNATSLNMTRTWVGSVLSPYAAFTNGNNIDGTLVAASLTQRGEIHDKLFTGNLPTPPVTPVPEPETYALMVLGLAGIGAFTRRRSLATKA